MKWRFSCYVCGSIYELQHRSLHKEDFMNDNKKGRPMINCVDCEMNDCNTSIVGDMIGQRT